MIASAAAEKRQIAIVHARPRPFQDRQRHVMAMPPATRCCRAVAERDLRRAAARRARRRGWAATNSLRHAVVRTVGASGHRSAGRRARLPRSPSRCGHPWRAADSHTVRRSASRWRTKPAQRWKRWCARPTSPCITAKEAGRNRFCWFETGDGARAAGPQRDRNRHPQRHRRAANSCPISSSRSISRRGRLMASRCWRAGIAANHGMIPPERFIPIAEETGLIGELSLRVIRQAMEHRRELGSVADARGQHLAAAAARIHGSRRS